MKGRTGRPRLDPNDESVDVHFCLPSKIYDQTQQAADRVRLTHTEWLRAVVTYAANPKARPPR